MTYLIEGETGDWEVVIGLEVHAQIVSEAKLFSGAATAFGAGPNTQVSLVDAAMPGMLPVINATCVSQAVKTGLGLKAKINRHSVFERKNYFYADLPQGYQISQYAEPIVGEGTVVLDMPDGTTRSIGPSRVDPRTGQIFDADIVMDEGFITGWARTWKKLMPEVAMEGFGPQTYAWLENNPQWDPRVLLF